MSVLIENILTVARERDPSLDVESVDLATLAEDCWSHVETANAALRIETDAVVRADRTRLAQLLENLIRNAVEHGSTSPDSQTHRDTVENGFHEPRLAGSSGHRGERLCAPFRPQRPDRTRPPERHDHCGRSRGRDRRRLRRRDDGPGIPADDRDRVFGERLLECRRRTGPDSRSSTGSPKPTAGP